MHPRASERCAVSKTIYLYWYKETNQEKGRYGIQEAEDSIQDRDGENSQDKGNSRSTSVQQTWKAQSRLELEDGGIWKRCLQEGKSIQPKGVMNFLINLTHKKSVPQCYQKVWEDLAITIKEAEQIKNPKPLLTPGKIKSCTPKRRSCNHDPLVAYQRTIFIQ